MIYYVTRVVIAEIFNAIKDWFMNKTCPKGQRQRLDLPGRCPNKCEIDLGCDLPDVKPVSKVSIEDLVDAKFSAKDITNPEFLNTTRKAKACNRLIKDICND